MKSVYILCFLCFSLVSFSRSEGIAGDYEVRFDTTNADFKYSISLQPDGTFTFYAYENHLKAMPPKKSFYGKGRWEATKKIVTFLTDPLEHIDEKYTLNFTNSRARFVVKSPRDKSDSVIRTALLFLESDIPWVKGKRLFKH